MEIHTDPPPYRLLFVAIAVGLAIAAALHALTKLPQANADADATRAQIPNQVSAQATQTAIFNNYLENINPEKIETAQRWERAKQNGLIILIGGIAFLLLTSAIVNTSDKTAHTQRTAADLKLYQTQRQQESLNPVHTPTGFRLTQYVKDGVLYNYSQLAGFSARADDERGNKILTEHHTAIAAPLLIAIIEAQRDSNIAQALNHKRGPAPQLPLDEWIAQ